MMTSFFPRRKLCTPVRHTCELTSVDTTIFNNCSFAKWRIRDPFTQISIVALLLFLPLDTVKHRMNRRRFLTCCSGFAAITIAGCTEVDEEGPNQEEIDENPEDVLGELREAVENEDIDRLMELLHSDSPARQQLDTWEPGSEEPPKWVLVFVEQNTGTISEPREHELIEETDTEAAICGKIRYAGETVPGARFDFRAEDGQWRLWDAIHAGLGSYPDAPEEFEECSKLVIRIHRLPDPARLEAETALEEGSYETDEEPYLPHLLDPDESYLAVEEDDGRTEYRLQVEQDGETTILKFEETIASWGVEPLTIANDTDESVTVDITVERERTEEIVVDETLTIEPDAATDTEPYDREFGSYNATLETEAFAEEFALNEGENQPHSPGFGIGPAGIGVEPAPELEPIDCQSVWEERIEFTEECEPIRD